MISGDVFPVHTANDQADGCSADPVFHREPGVWHASRSVSPDGTHYRLAEFGSATTFADR